MAFYWCLDHGVTEDDNACRAEVRLGPYPTKEGAEHALADLHARQAEQDAKDKAWNERGERS